MKNGGKLAIIAVVAFVALALIFTNKKTETPIVSENTEVNIDSANTEESAGEVGGTDETNEIKEKEELEDSRNEEITHKDSVSEVQEAEKNTQSMNTTLESLKVTHTATLETSAGDITLDLFGEAAPKTVENFVKLANEGLYSDTRFHRIIENFMIQGGDPNTKGGEETAPWGTGGPGYKFEDEIHSANLNEVGTISMANAGPNTNGSQFFINVNNNDFLNGKHTVFGKVSAGMDIVSELSGVATLPGDRPTEEVVIKGVKIENK